MVSQHRPETVVGTKIVCDELESLIVVVNFGIEICEVETVCNILFINFTEVFVPLAP
jgi:hypothetical protein